jgi:TPR repeat protein
MTPAFKTVFFILVLTLSFAVPVAASPLEDAVAAERRDDHATAIPIYRSLAEKGNSAAMTRLGYFYEIGWGVKRDWLEAAKWYSKAFEAGDESAAGSLGFIGRNWRTMYRTSDIDPTLYELVEKAAKKGNATAQFSLGVMYYPGLGASSSWFSPFFDDSKANLQEALIWYRHAAEQGDFDSQVVLGTAYEDGIGVPQDYVEAHKWYNLAAPRSKAGHRSIQTTQRYIDGDSDAQRKLVAMI